MTTTPTPCRKAAAIKHYLHNLDEQISDEEARDLYDRYYAVYYQDDEHEQAGWAELRGALESAGLSVRNTEEHALAPLFELIEARVQGKEEPAPATRYTAEAARAHANALRVALLTGEGETLHLPYKGNLTSAETILADYIATHSGAAARRFIELISDRSEDGSLAGFINNCIGEYTLHLQGLTAD